MMRNFEKLKNKSIEIVLAESFTCYTNLSFLYSLFDLQIRHPYLLLATPNFSDFAFCFLLCFVVHEARRFFMEQFASSFEIWNFKCFETNLVNK
jgi:hypothetical protein